MESVGDTLYSADSLTQAAEEVEELRCRVQEVEEVAGRLAGRMPHLEAEVGAPAGSRRILVQSRRIRTRLVLPSAADHAKVLAHPAHGFAATGEGRPKARPRTRHLRIHPGHLACLATEEDSRLDHQSSRELELQSVLAPTASLEAAGHPLRHPDRIRFDEPGSVCRRLRVLA